MSCIGYPRLMAQTKKNIYTPEFPKGYIVSGCRGPKAEIPDRRAAGDDRKRLRAAIAKIENASGGFTPM
jgi:hypothetical protein